MEKKQAIIIALVVIVLLLVIFNPVKCGGDAKAKARLETVFEGIMVGVDEEDVKYQTAMCQLWNGRDLISDEGELDAAYEHFREWRAKGGITEPIAYYMILETENISGADVPTVLITVEINNKKAKLKVPQSLPITWVD